MDAVVEEKKLKALAKELAKDIKTEKDLNALSAELVNMTVEAALGAEMEHHLSYEKHAPEGRNSGNSRNGTFEPKLLGKGQTRLTDFDDQILCLYAKGMTTRQIVESFKEMYEADISATLVSKVTEAVIDQVAEWQNRPLEPLYPMVYLDCIVVMVSQSKQVINKSIYIALVVDLEGHKQFLGLWIADTVGAKFWLSVLTELKTRGLEDILIACVDGLSGFSATIETVIPIPGSSCASCIRCAIP